MRITKITTLFLSSLMALFLLYSCGKPAAPTSPGGDNPPAATNSFTETVTGTPPAATYTPTMTITNTVTNTRTPTNTGVTTPTYTPTLGDDAYEGDWLYTMAKPIYSGIIQNHSIFPADDPDWVVFTLTASYSNISITAASPGKSFDIWIYTDPSTFSTIGESHSGSPCSVYIENVPAGTYYAAAQSMSQLAAINWYTLSLQVWTALTPTPTVTDSATETPTDTYTVTGTFTKTPTFTHTETITNTETATHTPSPMPTDVYEADNNTWTARVVTNGTNELNHTLSPAGDEDWYEFTIPELAYVSISAASDDQVYDIRLYVFNTMFWAGPDSPVYSAMGNSSGYAYVMTEFMAGTYRARIFDSNTGSPLWYNFHFSFITCTPTNTDTPTLTPTFTSTFTHTPDLSDIYEPDNTSYTAKPITDGETQNRTSFPVMNYDWLYFDTTEPMVISATATCGAGEYIWIALYNSTGVQFDTYLVQEGIMTEATTLTYYLATAGRYWLRATSAGITSTYSLSMLYMTPTYTFTPTSTLTVTETSTTTPTRTPTVRWVQHALYTFGPATNSRVAADPAGSTISASYLYNTPSLYVDNTIRVASVEQARTGGRHLYRDASYTYISYADSSGYVYAKSSENWSALVGTTFAGGGYYPNVYADSGYVYIAFADTANSDRITVRRASTGAWTDYGTAGFSNAVNTISTTGNSLVMDGYNSGTLNLYTAYKDSTNSNRISVMYHNGTAWGAFGPTSVSTCPASDFDMDVLDNSSVYVALMASDGDVYVSKGNGTAWQDLGGGGPVYSNTGSLGTSKYISIFAVSANEVYLAFTNYNGWISAMKYNGSDWSYMGNSGGIIQGSYPAITFMNSRAYFGAIDINASSKLKIMRAE